MYQIKKIPEDFIVKEISNLEIKKSGQYAYCQLEKKNWTVLGALARISSQLGINAKDIGFAGNKDKIAITEQFISIKNLNNPNKINQLNLKDIKLTYLGQGNSPICLGDLVGNYFEITVRNLDNFNFKEIKEITNYFDSQRFSSQNIEVGKSIIKKEFNQVCKRLNLEVKNNNYIGALQQIPKRLLLLYAHAYQSYLWNETVKELIQEKIRVEEIPLFGFATELNQSKIKEAITKILKQEGINQIDFIIRPLPFLSLEGGSRKMYTPIKDFKILEKTDDELNPEKKKVKISFILDKGCYATQVIKEIWDQPQSSNNL